MATTTVAPSAKMPMAAVKSHYDKTTGTQNRESQQKYAHYPSLQINITLVSSVPSFIMYRTHCN